MISVLCSKLDVRARPWYKQRGLARTSPVQQALSRRWEHPQITLTIYPTLLSTPPTSSLTFERGAGDFPLTRVWDVPWFPHQKGLTRESLVRGAWGCPPTTHKIFLPSHAWEGSGVGALGDYDASASHLPSTPKEKPTPVNHAWERPRRRRPEDAYGVGSSYAEKPTTTSG